MLPLFSPPRAPIYRYSPIISRPRAFRLIRILPPHRAFFGDTLRIEIITVDADSPCLYDTLSYTWGSTNGRGPDRRILVETQHGPRELRIYQSLELTLLSIKANRPIFVDQICINQCDDVEKANQVQLMHDIYANCSQLLVWLGPETKLSNEYFSYTCKVCDEGILSRFIIPGRVDFPQIFDAVMNSKIEVTGSIREDRDDVLMLLSKYGESYPVDGLEDVLRRPWFNRLWIIQEVCLAPNVLFICGSKDMSFEYFRLGLLFYTIYNTFWLENLKRAVSQAELTQRDNIFGLNQSPIRMIQERKAIHMHGKRHSLYNLIIKYNTNGDQQKIGATLAEDRVFGIMGLADAQSLMGMNIRYGDVSGIFTEIAAFLVVQNLDVLLFSQFPKHIPNLPSWAPDWSMNLQIPASYLTLQEPIFSAGGAMTVKPNVDLNSRCLVARGVAVSNIVRVGQQTMVKDQDQRVVQGVDCRSVKRFFDEIDVFIPQSCIKDDIEMAAIRLAGFDLSMRQFAARYPDDSAERLKKTKEQLSKWGQRLIDTDNIVSSYHISRVFGTVGVTPWYWIPASETDALQLWAVNPVAAFTKWVKAAGMFVFDLIGISVASANVVLVSKYLRLRRKYSRMDLNAAGRDGVMKRVGLDPEMALGEMSFYSNDLVKNVGQKVYLTEEGHIGTGCNDIQEGDTVVVLFGASVPHILRKNESGTGEDTWSYISEAYCDGIMHGEILGGDGVDFHII
ncbi:heterokaryon incompatibility protein [Ilyonectria destructans]|nr:heterokaryon incompatibility protein [Ilyonectria destructans]